MIYKEDRAGGLLKEGLGHQKCHDTGEITEPTVRLFGLRE